MTLNHIYSPDPRLAEILLVEPGLQPILDQAAHQPTGRRYDRILAFSRLREQLLPLVGWHAAHPELRNSADYQLVLETLINLLPPDRLDLRYPPPLPYRRPEPRTQDPHPLGPPGPIRRTGQPPDRRTGQPPDRRTGQPPDRLTD